MILGFRFCPLKISHHSVSGLFRGFFSKILGSELWLEKRWSFLILYWSPCFLCWSKENKVPWLRIKIWTQLQDAGRIFNFTTNISLKFKIYFLKYIKKRFVATYRNHFKMIIMIEINVNVLFEKCNFYRYSISLICFII